jgi:DNA-binding winged helix-turn-helix (wHTH) protein
LDIDRVEVRVAGQAHHLPPVQFKLLKYLMESPGRVFRRQELLDHIWGEGYAVEGHTLDVHICWLRRLLAHDPSSRQAITTIRGVGVKFVINPAADQVARVCVSRLRQPTSSRASRSRRRVRRHLRVIQPRAMRVAG